MYQLGIDLGASSVKSALLGSGNTPISMMEESPHFEELFLAVLAGDLIWAAPQDERQSLAGYCGEALSQNALSIEWLTQWAAQVFNTCPGDFSDCANSISVLGEPACLFDGQLGNYLLAQVEKRGFALRHMPLSEYLWFLWYSREQKGGGKKRLAKCEGWMDQLAGNMGGHSPFSENRDQLITCADQALYRYAGGNGRYRYAKCAEILQTGRAVITVNSLYENTGTILSMLGVDNKQSLLELCFDDTSGAITKERLYSFLHYQTKNTVHTNRN